MPPRRLLAVLLVATLDYTLRYLWGSWGLARQLVTEPWRRVPGASSKPTGGPPMSEAPPR